MEKEKYQPSEEEVKKAEEMMTPEERKSSVERELSIITEKKEELRNYFVNLIKRPSVVERRVALGEEEEWESKSEEEKLKDEVDGNLLTNAYPRIFPGRDEMEDLSSFSEGAAEALLAELHPQESAYIKNVYEKFAPLLKQKIETSHKNFKVTRHVPTVNQALEWGWRTMMKAVGEFASEVPDIDFNFDLTKVRQSRGSLSERMVRSAIAGGEIAPTFPIFDDEMMLNNLVKHLTNYALRQDESASADGLHTMFEVVDAIKTLVTYKLEKKYLN